MAKSIRRDYGPDDPIFSQGPQSFVPVSRPSTASSQTATTEVQPLDPNETYSQDHPRYAEAVQENPMLPAQNGLEAAVRKLLEESNPGFKVDPRTGELVPIQSKP